MDEWVRSVFVDRGDELSELMVAARTFVVYCAAILIVRFGKKRFFAESTAFDIILGVMLGSVLSRGINGSADLGSSLAAAGTLVGLHWLFSWVAYRWSWFSRFIKGSSNVLIEDGKILHDQLAAHHITEDELKGALRLQCSSEDASTVQSARLERSGEISVIPRQKEPRVVTVKVEDGVQTVRVEFADATHN